MGRKKSTNFEQTGKSHKILENSGIFGSPEKWEPWIALEFIATIADRASTELLLEGREVQVGH